MDLNHVDVMKNLSKSMTYFSTCYHETWGITALEALSHGVPIILNSKKNINVFYTRKAQCKNK